jgi:hypothetical protein
MAEATLERLHSDAGTVGTERLYFYSARPEEFVW